MPGRFSLSVLSTTLLLGLTSLTQAQQQQDEGSLADLIREARARLIEQNDTNGDGKLDANEQADAADSFREEMRKAGEVMRKEWEKQFDKDGDGKLSDEEREAMRADWEKRAETWRKRADDWAKKAREKEELNKYDENKDGILSDSEKAKMEADKKAAAEALEKTKKEIIEAYDTDKDGKLSPNEVAVMKEKVAKQLEHLKKIVTAAQAFEKEDDKILTAVSQQISGFRFMERQQRWNMWRRQMEARR